MWQIGVLRFRCTWHRTDDAGRALPPGARKDDRRSEVPYAADSRKLLQTKAIDIDNDLRGTLRNFGLKVGVVGKVGFERWIRELVEGRPDLASIAEAMHTVRKVLRQQFAVLNTQLMAIVRADEVCRRLMTIPGVGPVVASTFRTTVDVPARFKNSKKVGAAFGLAPRQNQSGESNQIGAISKCGDAMIRVMLYEAAQTMLTRSAKWSWLKAWAMKIAKRRGMNGPSWRWRDGLPWSCVACGWTAPSSSGREISRQQRENESYSEKEKLSSTGRWWSDIPGRDDG
jgi:transposase